MMQINDFFLDQIDSELVAKCNRIRIIIKRLVIKSEWFEGLSSIMFYNEIDLFWDKIKTAKLNTDGGQKAGEDRGKSQNAV